MIQFFLNFYLFLGILQMEKVEDPNPHNKICRMRILEVNSKHILNGNLSYFHVKSLLYFRKVGMS